MAKQTGTSHIQRGRPTVALLVAILLPVIAFAVLQAVVIVGETKAQAERTAMESARSVIARVDAEVMSNSKALAAIAQSIKGVPILKPNPPPERARYNAEIFPGWAGVLVWSRETGKALFSSLPVEGLPEIPEDWQTTAASDINVMGGVTTLSGIPAALLHRRMPEDDRDLVLTLAMRPEAFQAILMFELPAGAVGAVVDRNGNFVARSVDFEERVGTPATAYVRDAIAAGKEGIYRGRTYEGFENYTAFVTSAVTGWSAHIAIANTLIDAPRSTSLLVGLAGGLICLGLMAGLFFLIAEDNRKRRQAEQMLTQAQKLETLGLLTGGIAHDFNNLLTVIMGSLEKLKRTVAGPQAERDAQAAVEAALSSSRRAAGLTRSLLAYSRQQTLTPRVIATNEFVAHMTEIASRTLGEKFSIDSQLDGDAGAIEIDDNQLGSAVLNLAVNARDAMPEGGKILFLTEQIVLRQGDKRLGLKAGEYTRISVRDDGPGMPPDVAAKAFEPFFTTKGVGKGTGLGLAQVEGFARQSGGAADIETASGRGTSVHLYLPRTGKPVLASASDPMAEPRARVSGLRILVVEDEADVRSNACDLLQDLGHEAIACATAEEALAAVHASRFDLLFTDIVLTGDINGAVLAESCQRVQRSIKVLLTTGYARDALREGQSAPVVLAKPYGRDDLAMKLEEAMRQEPVVERRKILLVEDEALIRMIARETLEEGGFEVIEAATAAEAIEEFKQDPTAFGLAIIDLGLPDEPGDRLAEKLRLLQPALPVLIASGSVQRADNGQTDGPNSANLPKPYDPAELDTAVRRLLGVTAAAMASRE